MAKQKIRSEQLLLLREGNTIIRYPCDGMPENEFNENNIDQINSFEIRSINPANNVMELIINHSVLMYASPGDVNHLFIKTHDLVSQKIWWVEV